MPDERCRVLRRRLALREQLVRARTRVKNEIHAVLQRRLQGKPPCSDLFGVKGRRWLAGLDCRSRNANRSTPESGMSNSWSQRSPRSSG
jgi:transposase